MNEINLMKKLLYLLVMPLILAACNPKVELTSAGMYPNYQVSLQCHKEISKNII